MHSNQGPVKGRATSVFIQVCHYSIEVLSWFKHKLTDCQRCLNSQQVDGREIKIQFSTYMESGVATLKLSMIKVIHP